MFMIYTFWDISWNIKILKIDFRFSLSWKTLLLNLFLCLVNPFVINDAYKSLKQNVSITSKASKAVFVFWEAVVQRCFVKKILKNEILGQMFSFFIEHLWWLLLYLYYKTWRILKIDWSSFFKIMNENHFNDFYAITRFQAYQEQRRCKKLFLFFSLF